MNTPKSALSSRLLYSFYLSKLLHKVFLSKFHFIAYSMKFIFSKKSEQKVNGTINAEVQWIKPEKMSFFRNFELFYLLRESLETFDASHSHMFVNFMVRVEKSASFSFILLFALSKPDRMASVLSALHKISHQMTKKGCQKLYLNVK